MNRARAYREFYYRMDRIAEFGGDEGEIGEMVEGWRPTLRHPVERWRWMRRFRQMGREVRATTPRASGFQR